MNHWNVYYKRFKDDLPVLYVEDDVPGDTEAEALSEFWQWHPKDTQYTLRIIKVEETTY